MYEVEHRAGKIIQKHTSNDYRVQHKPDGYKLVLLHKNK